MVSKIVKLHKLQSILSNPNDLNIKVQCVRYSLFEMILTAFFCNLETRFHVSNSILI